MTRKLLIFCAQFNKILPSKMNNSLEIPNLKPTPFNCCGLLRPLVLFKKGGVDLTWSCGTASRLHTFTLINLLLFRECHPRGRP